MNATLLQAVSVGFFKILYFTISTVFYLALMKLIVPRIKKRTSWLKPYLFFGWSGFPLVFIFAPAGYGLIGALAANTLYFLLDAYTKIIFSVELAKKTKQT